MRKLLLALALLAVQAQASMITAEFSGIWDHDAGDFIHAGDAFWGTASWDTGDLVESSSGIFQSSLKYSFYLSSFDVPGLLAGSSQRFNPVLLYVRGNFTEVSDDSHAYVGTGCVAPNWLPVRYMATFTPTGGSLYCSNDYFYDWASASATNYSFTLTPPPVAVSAAPEPGSVALVGLVLCGIAWKRRSLVAPQNASHVE